MPRMNRNTKKTTSAEIGDADDLKQWPYEVLK